MNKKSLVIIIISIVVVVLAGLLASTLPDGLEKVAKSLGFDKKAAGSPAVFIDHILPAFPYPTFSIIIGGLIGIIIIIFIFKSIAKVRYLGELLRKLLNIQ